MSVKWLLHLRFSNENCVCISSPDQMPTLAWVTAVLNTPDQFRFWSAGTEVYWSLQLCILQEVHDLSCWLYFVKSKLHFTSLTVFSLSFGQAKRVRLTSHTNRIILNVRNRNKWFLYLNMSTFYGKNSHWAFADIHVCDFINRLRSADRNNPSFIQI
jgi:hypothetical protein